MTYKVGQYVRGKDDPKERGQVRTADAFTDRVLVKWDSLKYPTWVKPSNMRPETFCEYLFSRTGFGKTRWGAFAAMQFVLFSFLIFGLASWKDGGWVGVVSFTVINAVLVFGSWMNYTGKWR